VRLHRVISWWLFFFGTLTIVGGYSISNKWVPNITFFTTMHNIFEWAFIFLMLYHLFYTLFFVRLRTFKMLKHPFRHWVRLIQQASKWAILAFVTLIILSGFNQYEWAAPFLAGWAPFQYHKLFDTFLVVSIVIHMMAGTKIMLRRKKISTWWSNLLILVIGGLLIAGTLVLELLPS
ncbi:unnamed protein product, partial [marine sediment metagenome]